MLQFDLQNTHPDKHKGDKFDFRQLDLVLDGHEPIVFSINEFGKTQFREGVNPRRIFDAPNGYLATLTPERQEEIFKCYAEIHDALTTIGMQRVLVLTLRQKLTVLCRLLDVDGLYSYCSANVRVYAESVSEEYSTASGTRELTYTRSEYCNLVYLGVLMKFVLPVVAGFISKIGKEVGSNFKEYAALNLLPSEITELEEFQRLFVYVTDYTGFLKRATSAVYSGLGTEEVPEWLMSWALFRKVAVFDNQDPTSNLVAAMYKYLKSRLNTLGREMSKNIKVVSDKNRPTDKVNEEDNQSMIEYVRAKEDKDPQDPEECNAYILHNYQHMAQRMAPGINPDLVEECVENSLEQNIVYSDMHYMLCGTLLRIPSSANLVYHISPQAMNILAGVCQAVFYNDEFPELGILCTAEIREKETNKFGMDIGGEGKRKRITRDRVRLLQERFPHYRRQSASPLEPKNNVGSEWVERLFGCIVHNSLKCHIPESLQGGPFIDSNNTYVMPANFRSIVADWVMETLTVKYQSINNRKVVELYLN